MARQQPSTFALLLPVYVPTILVSFASGFIIPIMPSFVDSFGVSAFVLGLILAADGLGMLLSEIPAGRIVQRVSPKWAMGSAGVLMAGATGSIPFAENVFTVAILLATTGVGLALWGLSRHAYLASITISGNRGRASSIFGGVSRIGVFLGPLVGGFLGERFGFDAPFFAYCAVAIVGVVVVLLFVPATEPRRATTQAATRAQLRAARPLLLRAGVPQALIQTLRAGRKILLPLVASLVLGLDLETTGFIVALAGGVDMALFPFAGWLMDRFGRKFAIVPSIVLQTIGMACLPFVSSATGLVLVALLLGFGNGISAGTMMTLGADLAPSGAVAVFLSYWRLIGDAGAMMAPLLVGSAAQFIGLSSSATAVAAAGAIGAVWFTYFVPETLEKQAATSRSP